MPVRVSIIALVVLLFSFGCSANSTKGVAKFVGRSVLNSAVDVPVSDSNSARQVPASSAIDGLKNIHDSAEQREHSENVEEYSSEYEEFLRERNAVPEQGDEKRSVIFRDTQNSNEQ